MKSSPAPYPSDLKTADENGNVPCDDMELLHLIAKRYEAEGSEFIPFRLRRMSAILNEIYENEGERKIAYQEIDRVRCALLKGEDIGGMANYYLGAGIRSLMMTIPQTAVNWNKKFLYRDLHDGEFIYSEPTT